MLKLNVPDMTCGHCARAIDEAVKTVDPSARVDVDLTAKTVRIESAAEAQRISEAVRSAGYENTAAHQGF